MRGIDSFIDRKVRDSIHRESWRDVALRGAARARAPGTVPSGRGRYVLAWHVRCTVMAGRIRPLQLA
jgi:hypothetical protein